MLFRRHSQANPEDAESKLQTLVRDNLAEADDATVRIVAACAGLLGCVAYADRDFSDTERRRVHELLQTVNGISEDAANAIQQALDTDIIELSTVHTQRFTRTLKELCDRELRLQVLSLLLEVAAADDEISQSEVKILRQLTAALGLEQSDYNALQEVHRDKLASLKS